MTRSFSLQRLGSSLAALLGLGAFSAPAWAMGLEVQGPDAERVRQAVRGELARLPTAADGRLVILRPAPGQATIVFEASDGRRLERSIFLQEDAQAGAQEIALLAANLVTNEAGGEAEVWEEGGTGRGASEEPLDEPSGEATKATVAERPQAAAPSETERSTAKPEVTPSWKLESPCGTDDEYVLPVGADFVPYLGMSSNERFRGAVRILSLNAVGGLSGGLRGFELGNVFNIQTRFACGVQIGGALNVVEGPVQGAQIAGATNIVDDAVDGFQLTGGVNVVGGDVTGAQIAGGVNVVEGTVTGVQIAGGASIVEKGVSGLQLAGGGSFVEGALEGAQIAGGVNIVEGNVRGAQLAGGSNIVDGSVGGVQIAGGANIIDGNLRGVQIAGGANVAVGVVRGVQIGVVNVAEKSDFSLGVVSVNNKGRTHVDGWSIVELGVVAAGLKHGGDHWHSIYGVGTRLNDVAPVFVLGFGGHVPLSDSFYLDVDALGYGVHRFEGGATDAWVLQGRAVGGWRLSEHVALFAGPSYNVLLSRRDAPAWEPSYARSAGSSTDPRVHLWPGAVVGVQLFAD